MEYYRTLYKNTCTNGSSSSSNGVRGHDGNFTSHAWDVQSSWDLIGGTYNNNNNSNADDDDGGYPPYNALGFAGAGAGATHARNPDPHLTCLKLGKRNYFEDVVVVSTPPPKKGKAAYCGGPGPAPRCQVEGCESALESAKDYHRRHKVCEMHAKAPRVVVHGMEQRFCQQCSRFHAVTEFDESKRSCRRRLAGHNERRRKHSTSQDHHRHSQGKYPHSSVNSSGECALSLLSSSANYENPWNYVSPSSSSDDLPARCSAALRELIAENRASVLACRQLPNPNHVENCNNRLGLGRGGPKLSGSAAGHVTLDLMQDPDSAFGLLSVHDHKSPKNQANGDQDCSDLWRVPLGY